MLPMLPMHRPGGRVHTTPRAHVYVYVHVYVCRTVQVQPLLPVYIYTCACAGGSAHAPLARHGH